MNTPGNPVVINIGQEEIRLCALGGRGLVPFLSCFISVLSFYVNGLSNFTLNELTG